jgi:hypothetical protein
VSRTTSAKGSREPCCAEVEPIAPGKQGPAQGRFGVRFDSTDWVWRPARLGGGALANGARVLL